MKTLPERAAPQTSPSSRERRPGARRRLATGVTAASVALGTIAVFANAPAYWLIVEDPLDRADAALVMTGDVDYERTKAAARLVVSGYARLLIVTGGEPSPGDSAASLRSVAIREGVPPDCIRAESVSANTRESLVAVAPVLSAEGVKTVLLVTSPYHQRRASLAARRALPDVRIINRPAPCAHWTPAGWFMDRSRRRIVMSEYGKLAYYLWRGWV